MKASHNSIKRADFYGWKLSQRNMLHLKEKLSGYYFRINSGKIVDELALVISEIAQ